MSAHLQTASVVPPGGGRVLDFRRRTAPPKRRRKSFLRSLVKPLATAMGVVGLPLGLMTWVVTSPAFALREVEVAGTRRVPAQRVRRALAPLSGDNLVLLALPAVETRLAQIPWVESVEVAKELPDRLRVKVAERRAVALVVQGSGLLYYADVAGRPIAPVPPGEKAAGLLVVRSAAPGSDGVARALAVASELKTAAPEWAAMLEEVEVLGEEDFCLRTRALPFTLFVRGGEVGPKVRRLEALLPELGRRYVALEAVDLRFSRRIVVKPAAVPETGKAAAL